jgi:predicted nucleic acid-binding protein
LKKLVLDSSVVVKWLPMFWREPLVNEALELHRKWDAGEIEISVPEFFWLEVTAILWKANRRGNCTAVQAEMAFQSLLGLKIPTVESGPLLQATLGIATRHARSVYDCLYVALAYSQQAEFITADEKLVNAVSGRLPVKWVGSFFPEAC